MTRSFQNIVLALCVGAIISLPTLSFSASANQSADTQKASQKKTRRVPTLRGKVYEQLARAQSYADNDQTPEAFAALKEIEGKKSSMNSYEMSDINDIVAFVHSLTPLDLGKPIQFNP